MIVGGDHADGWAPDVIRPEPSTQLIGRSSTSTIRILHPAISRHHAELRVLDGRSMLRDLGSRLGTRINGKRIEAWTALKEDDRVEFGPVVYVYRGQQLWRLENPDGVLLECHGLTLRRGARELLSRVQLSILPNQFVGILGPSGAGKTTLMKCLAGYRIPSSGQLTFDGLPLPAHLDRFRVLAGFVPQDDVVYGPLTGRENLEFALRLRMGGDLRALERADIVAGILQRLGLAGDADKRVSVLSGGQRKRLNVALELISRPRLLLLDEPTSGLDPAMETRLMRRLKELSRRGITVVCSTHVMENLAL